MPERAAPGQVWELVVGDRRHRVEVRGSVSRRLSWFVDDELVVEKKSHERDDQLADDERPDLGAVSVRHTSLGRPRRATLFEQSSEGERTALMKAVLNVGGLDLEPVPGSPAATHEERVRANPRRYAVLTVLTGLATVIVPLLVAALLARIAISLPLPSWDPPDIPWPDIPWPDIAWPDIRWQDLPPIPWPQWTLPRWLDWLLDRVHFVWPVLLACYLARSEIRRRRTQDELRAARAAERRVHSSDGDEATGDAGV